MKIGSIDRSHAKEGYFHIGGEEIEFLTDRNISGIIAYGRPFLAGEAHFEILGRKFILMYDLYDYIEIKDEELIRNWRVALKKTKHHYARKKEYAHIYENVYKKPSYNTIGLNKYNLARIIVKKIMIPLKKMGIYRFNKNTYELEVVKQI